ncbi:MAG: hypothetical protein H0X27_00745 [Caulobacteraceae bacterium]|nr:hypothetical protein [Caulobacteraceae bacterium]
MILSVHMPKTGGETFRDALEAAFGPRVLRDYGDRGGFVSDQILRVRRRRARAARADRDEIERRYDVIHGHFIADKYLGLFHPEHYVAFFRHPMQQAISHYKYLRRIPPHNDPTIRAAQDPEMTFVDFLKQDTVTNCQSELIGSAPLEHFAVVALSEEFDRGVALFNATFGRAIEVKERTNVDPQTAGRKHVLSPEERRAVRTHRGADLELYQRAKRTFHRLCEARDL